MTRQQPVRIRSATAADAGRCAAIYAPYKPRAAYRWTCEVSIYLEPGVRRRGTGRALYQALLDEVSRRGFRVAVASMALPNEPSTGLHRALDFTSVGVLRGVGWKHGRWHDVELLQRHLDPGPGPAGRPLGLR